jgi:hypothetical protein
MLVLVALLWSFVAIRTSSETLGSSLCHGPCANPLVLGLFGLVRGVADPELIGSLAIPPGLAEPTTESACRY